MIKAFIKYPIVRIQHSYKKYKFVLHYCIMKHASIFFFLLFTGLFCFGQAPVVFTGSNGSKGFKTKDGKILIAPKYSEVTGDFSNGPVRVKLNNKYGFVGYYGTELIKPQYDSADTFFWGKASVKIGQARFYIDTANNKSDSEFDFSNLFDTSLTNLFGNFNFFKANDFYALKKINMVCDKFDNGDYYGEASSKVADGYGMYIFADSSFYAGEFVLGAVRGNGVLYDKSGSVIKIGKWRDGKLVGDYLNTIFNDYKVQWYTVQDKKEYFRSAMQVNNKFVITSNMLGALTNNKRNLITILDETSLSTMYGSLDNDLQYDGKYASFDYPGTLKVNKVNHGVYESNITAEPSFNNSAIPNAENTLGYKFSNFLYPIKGLAGYDNLENYFGKVNGNIPQGFGSMSSDKINYHLLSAVFNAGQPTGFKQEIYNTAADKFFYSGDFKEEYKDKNVIHSGSFAKVVYHSLNDVRIQIGEFALEGNSELLRKGINFKIGPGFCSVIFTDKTGSEEVGYLMLPIGGAVYRGGMKDEKAEGIGEVLYGKTDIMNYAKWIQGVAQNDKITPPSFTAPNFLTFFDKPLKVIDEQ